MKKLKFLGTAFFITILACFYSVNAQTYQKDLHATIDDGLVACLNKQLSGEWTYHIAYHVNTKTGMLENFHWNLKHYDLRDSDGNEYVLVDTGNDNLGWFIWDYFNNLNANNEPYNLHYDNVEDGWLPVPDVLPEEGRFVSSAFKFIGNGEKVTWTILWIVHLNAKGELTADVYKEFMDCN